MRLLSDRPENEWKVFPLNKRTVLTVLTCKVSHNSKKGGEYRPILSSSEQILPEKVLLHVVSEKFNDSKHINKSRQLVKKNWSEEVVPGDLALDDEGTLSHKGSGFKKASLASSLTFHLKIM